MALSELFMRKQRHVQQLVCQYMDHWIACIRAFHEAWDLFLSHGPGEQFYYLVEATHKEESRADDMRRKIELELYSKALLPESRGDILGILETVDRVLSSAEQSLFEVQLQELVIPTSIRPKVVKLVDLSCKACESVNRVVRLVFGPSGGRFEEIIHIINEVDSLESEADHLERSLIRTIFKLDELDTGHKILLKELVRLLAKVSDRAEHVSDRLTLVSVKRRV